MSGQAYYDKDYEFEIALQIGAKKFPEYALSSQAETFAALKKRVGNHNSAFILRILHHRNIGDISLLWALTPKRF